MKKLLAESLHEYVNTIKDRNYVSTTTDDEFDDHVELERGSVISQRDNDEFDDHVELERGSVINSKDIKPKEPRINLNSSTHKVLQLINDHSAPKGIGINTKEILNSTDYHWKTVTDAIERLHRLHYISRHLRINPVTNRETYYYFITINGKKALAKIK